jgi:hypothetical protein
VSRLPTLPLCDPCTVSRPQIAAKKHGQSLRSVLLTRPHPCTVSPPQVKQVALICRARVSYPHTFSPEVVGLLSHLLVANPRTRYGMLKNGPEDITQHAWYAPQTLHCVPREDSNKSIPCSSPSLSLSLSRR